MLEHSAKMCFPRYCRLGTSEQRCIVNQLEEESSLVFVAPGGSSLEQGDNVANGCTRFLGVLYWTFQRGLTAPLLRLTLLQNCT